MNQHNLENVSYEDLYDFILESEDVEDLVIRLKIMTGKIIKELQKRFNNTKPITVFKTVEIIDEMNEEVSSLVRSINELDFVYGQPRIMESLLFGLISISNHDLLVDYNYVKKVLVN
jgi:hypothetical protein